MTEQNSGGGPVLKFFGLLLMAASVLWMAFCGLCGFWLVFSMIAEGSISLETAGGFLFVAAVSGAGAAAGFGLFLVARGLTK